KFVSRPHRNTDPVVECWSTTLKVFDHRAIPMILHLDHVLCQKRPILFSGDLFSRGYELNAAAQAIPKPIHPISADTTPNQLRRIRAVPANQISQQAWRNTQCLVTQVAEPMSEQRLAVSYVLSSGIATRMPVQAMNVMICAAGNNKRKARLF